LVRIVNNLDSEQAEVRETDLPRWVEVPVGLLLGFVMLLCLGGVATLVFSADEKAPVAAPAAGVILVLPSVWALGKCIRLITGRRTQGGLMGPRALRIIGGLFLLLPLGGLFTGYIRNHPMRSAYQALCCVGAFVGLHSLANARDRRTASEAEELEARVRLKRFREMAGKEPEDLAVFLGDSVSSYYDLEEHNGELYRSISLGELSAMCSAIGIKPGDLFGERADTEQAILLEELAVRVRAHLEVTGIELAEFEERVGFVIGPSLTDASKVMDWNVDFLRWFCRELGVDWRRALP
jgi:hypothetical protein